MLRLMKREQYGRKMIDGRTQGYDVMVTTWGQLSQPVCSESALYPSLCRDKGVLSSESREGTSGVACVQ